MRDANLQPDPDDALWPELSDHATRSALPDFVDRSLARIDADAEVAWSRVLAQHKVPAPSPDFVARVLTARTGEVPRPQWSASSGTQSAPTVRRPWLRAAAAAVLVGIGLAAWGRFGWRPDPRDAPPHHTTWARVAPAVRASAQPVATAFGRAARVTDASSSTFFTTVRFDHVDGVRLLHGPR